MTQITPVNNALNRAALEDFDTLVKATLHTVSASSARIYANTYRQWFVWCAAHDVDPLELTFAHVAAFLDMQPVGKTTRQRELSALRKLADMLSILDFNNPARDAAAKSLHKLKVRNGEAGIERERHALTPAQADKVLRVWSGEKLVDRRNKALIAVLFFSGLRRAEVAALRWTDIDLQEGVIHVRHGKGDVERDASIAGDYALHALHEWRSILGEEREYVFPSLAKGDKLGADEPTDAQTIYRVVKATEAHSGVRFSPHTARRTFITEALANGAPLADVQAQAGHRQESTTLRYARPVDARQRRSRLRLRYG